MPYCQICGTEYFEGRMFCRKCGTTLPRPEPSTVQPETAGADPDVVPPEGSGPQGWDSMPRPAGAPRGMWLTRNAALGFAAVVFVAVVIVAAVWLGKKSLPSGFYKADGVALPPPA